MFFLYIFVLRTYKTLLLCNTKKSDISHYCLVSYCQQLGAKVALFLMATALLIKEARVEGEPRSSSIQASIDGHTLSVVFLENLGQVNVAIMAVGGSEAQSESTPTPNGVDFYIPFTGNYIVYFTLPNGDTYYGEFEVTD